MIKPVTLCILDGWGIGKAGPYNAIMHANTPNWDKLVAEYGYAELETSGVAVGLPEGQMGNSEVGHMTIGAGRVLLQDLPRIDKAVAENKLGDFAAIKNIKGRCHIIGCFSDGGVHSHISHIKSLAATLEKNGVEVFIHALTDGRDVSQKSALKYLENFPYKIATIGGRYFAMDRDKRWDRLQKAYDAMVCGEGPKSNSAQQVVEQSYAANITDEFIIPHVIDGYEGMKDGDSFIIANFRADRVRQITSALVERNFSGFERKKIPNFATKITLTEYSEELENLVTVLFAPESPKNIMPEVVANAGLVQLRIAETEKYAHVTFFMSGGREKEFVGEKRVLVQSPRVATYDLQPEMSAPQVAEKIVEAIKGRKDALIIANFANTDMVGHTGNFSAAKKAVESVDNAIGKIFAATCEVGGALVITADHGNAEEMLDNEGNPHTQHSLGPVPFMIASEKMGRLKLNNGGLADVAPTVLNLLGLDIPSEMTGKILLSR